MRTRVLALFGLLALGTTSVAVLLHHRQSQREQREFAERYARQLRAAREAHKQALQELADGKASQSSVESSENEKDVSGAFVSVIYGSESGNAEALAKGFVFALRDRGVQAALVDPSRWAYLDEYLYRNNNHVPLFSPIKAPDSATGRQPLVYVFIVATAGEGEPTGNFMSLFHEMQLTVQKATTPAILPSAAVAAAPPKLPFKDVHYAVFGLGDSSYKYYCRCATDTNTLLKRGGGTNLHRVGFGDARSGLQEDAFDEWQEKVMQALGEKCGFVLTTGTRAPPKPEYQFRYLRSAVPSTAEASGTAITDSSIGTIKAEVSNPKKKVSVAELVTNTAPSKSTYLPFPPTPALLEPSLLNPTRIRLLSKTQLSPSRDSDGSSVYRFCFETEGTGISYQAGDHLSIFPTNPPDMVARCAKALAIPEEDLEVPVELCEVVASRGLLRNVLPACVPLMVVLQRYVDLCGRPKKSALRVLAKYCTDPAEQEEFFNLISLPADHQGEEHGDRVRKPRTVVDYLERFPSCCCIQLGHFIEIMPRIQPRYYSIASDRLSHGTKVEILVRVLTDGLSSSYLAHRVHEGDEVFGYVRISTFHLPQRIGENRPLLMIGPGTGAAAMVGLCYKKEALMRKQPTAQYGPTVFLFGAQHRATEYFVEEEVTRWSMGPEEMLKWDAEHRNSHAGMAAHRSKVQPPAKLPTPVITLHDSAFSRDQAEKIYVTNLIDKHKDHIYDMLTSTCGGGCLVYLSGDASFMAKDVDRALSALLQHKGGMTRIASLEFLRRMETDHRYLKDVY
ncbi:putative Cytochrome p450 reductase [Leptomonas seymouri]|uniref:Putative Cytochrome p450 reductase n=1 Tax=Leptomonas seymouri TaxID=5684 RepID=A0A0N1IBR8_LEPSE|nr:putative Cytochrome p450 reductase [Leptomonas seymouri]|eukprot:KPI90258.1 putative Cytochrome p450 reductase [Leptomonas seymouri]